MGAVVLEAADHGLADLDPHVAHLVYQPVVAAVPRNQFPPGKPKHFVGLEKELVAAYISRGRRAEVIEPQRNHGRDLPKQKKAPSSWGDSRGLPR
jgi:hypothetical protein